MRTILPVLLAALILAPSDASAQDSRLAPGVRAGAWFNDGDAWPTAALSLDWRLRDRFVFDVGYAAVRRPVVFCSGAGPDEPAECDERKTIHALTGGFRAELGSARARPYLGVFLGSTWYNERGGIFGARAGVRYPLSERVDAILDGSFNAVSDGGSFGGYPAATAGVSVKL